jgi:acetyl-CoA synthetase
MTDRYAEEYASFRWRVPARFNIAQYACRRWSSDPTRLALRWEDEGGASAALPFAALQEAANRLSNALRALGVTRGDRVALILPQRLETAIAYLAIFQMAAIAVPLSFLFGPEALAYRLQNSGARVAIVDPQTIANLWPARERAGELEHVIGVAGARERNTLDWETLLAKASPGFAPEATSAADPAAIIYTSGATGPPKGALLAHGVLIGNLPGFEYSHDGFPRDGDFFWSPADWAWTGGLWDALMPSLYHGCPILGYRGRFDPEKALDLMDRHSVRNAFLFPTALKMMMREVPAPGARHATRLRSLMSGGEALSPALLQWAREALGVTVNEIFGQTEMNYIVGNSHALWPVRPGSMGRPYPGHRVAIIDAEGREVPRGTVGEVAVHRFWTDGTPDPVFFLGYWRDAASTARKFTGDWSRTGDEASMDEAGYLWYQGRTDDMFKSAGYRIGPAEIENCLVKHPAVANCAVVPKADETRGAVVKAFVMLAPGAAPSDALKDELREHVKRHLAPYQQPREIEFVAALPMTTTGKVQRRLLRDSGSRSPGDRPPDEFRQTEAPPNASDPPKG